LADFYDIKDPHARILMYCDISGPESPNEIEQQADNFSREKAAPTRVDAPRTCSPTPWPRPGIGIKLPKKTLKKVLKKKTSLPLLHALIYKRPKKKTPFVKVNVTWRN
jgi:hypothetical protein